MLYKSLKWQYKRTVCTCFVVSLKRAAALGRSAKNTAIFLWLESFTCRTDLFAHNTLLDLHWCQRQVRAHWIHFKSVMAFKKKKTEWSHCTRHAINRLYKILVQDEGVWWALLSPFTNPLKMWLLFQHKMISQHPSSASFLGTFKQRKEGT